MKSVGLIVNAEKLQADREVGRLARGAVTLLTARHVDVVANRESAQTLGLPELGAAASDLARRIDGVLSLKGIGDIGDRDA